MDGLFIGSGAYRGIKVEDPIVHSATWIGTVGIALLFYAKMLMWVIGDAKRHIIDPS